MAYVERAQRDEARFGQMLAEIDAVTEAHHLKAGENIYLLTLLLVGSIREMPADIRNLFREAAVRTLLLEKGAGSALEALCLEGKIQAVGGDDAGL